jgi:hypothetical protein
MAGLEEVVRFRIAPLAIERAHEFMAAMGKKGHEGLALFLGTLNGCEALVTHTYIPRQRAIRTEHGLLLQIDSDALHQLNVDLYENKLRLLAQVHSHGEHAYHSSTDDEHSIITVLGGLSVVVPHFAVAPFDLSSAAAYRLTRAGWRELTYREKSEQIMIG